jgi:hypothetical protein
MGRTIKSKKSQSVQFLFTLVLFLGLVLCSVFVITFGARVYENVGQRMEDNFTGTTAISYVANKVRQMDEAGGIAVYQDKGQDILKLEQQISGKGYQTLIYYLDGSIRELFCETGAPLTLEDGIPILESEGIRFALDETGLLRIETLGEKGDALVLAVRSEGRSI